MIVPTCPKCGRKMMAYYGNGGWLCFCQWVPQVFEEANGEEH
jgi:ssDNA-binding Zn-finger/Zn-ribbon topoisomerase 1